MKKLQFLLTLICTLCITTTAFAMRYSVVSADSSIDIPNSFRVLTDTSIITEEECKDFHMTRTELLNMMHSGMLYLYGIDNDSHIMIQAMQMKDPSFQELGDLRKLNQANMDQIKNQLIGSIFAAKGIKTNEIIEYTNAGARYVVAEGVISTPDMQGEQAVARMFVTIVKGRMYMYSIAYGYASQLTPQQRGTCQSIIDSVQY